MAFYGNVWKMVIDQLIQGHPILTESRSCELRETRKIDAQES